MNVSIKILCPSGKCGICWRMISRVEEAIRLENIDAVIEFIDNVDEMLKFNTWILPTLIINEKIISRGYVPKLT